jgi:3-deoxy-manno-octulosonate cytidylyltransferase (CMP-KDO synthetase)
VIPARLESSRLPRKVLVDIGGRTMISRTYEVAVEARCGPVLVATDSEQVAEEVRGFGGEVVMTGTEIESGTERIASIVDRIETDVVVNLQGDAPLTDPAVVTQAAREAAASDAAVTMPVYRMERAEQVHDPSVVKVVRAHDGSTLYCSRSPIPHVRGSVSDAWAETATFWGHVGLYAYARSFLEAFSELPVSGLEDAERLEQLRWLEAGRRLHTLEVEPQGPSVDNEEQLERVRDMFARRETA